MWGPQQHVYDCAFLFLNDIYDSYFVRAAFSPESSLSPRRIKINNLSILAYYSLDWTGGILH